VIKQHVAGWIASFPDFRFSIEQMLIFLHEVWSACL